VTKRTDVRLIAWLLGALLASVPTLANAAPQAQSPPPEAAPASPAAQPAAAGTDTPITAADLERIQKALATSPSIDLDQERLRYYVRVLARQPTFAEFAKGYDFKNGPTRRGNPMTHQEFLNMVTPQDLHSSGGITALDTMQFAFTNWLGQSLVKKAIEDLRNARSEREVQEIRDRIERELAALKPPGAGN
jgi:hypothetical protein